MSRSCSFLFSKNDMGSSCYNDSMIKAIIFDLGGVLFTNGTKKFAKHIAEKHQLNFKDVYGILNYSEIGNAYREGKITRDVFYESFKKQFHIKDDTNKLEQKWIEVYQLVEETKEIIEVLRKKYKIYFLSDNVKERVEAAEKKYRFFKLFHGGVFSHEVGVRKPNTRIYEIALEKANVKSEETLFIDDKQINLPPAEKLGMNTLLFTSPEQLKADLIRMRLL